MGAAPVVETAVRVAGGDVVSRAYGAVAGGAAVTVLEVENRSPAAVTVAMVATIRGSHSVGVDGAVVRIDSVPRLILPRAPGGWASGPCTREIVMGGRAVIGDRTGSSSPPELRSPSDIAFLYPVPHRTVLRVCLTSEAVDVRSLPPADVVARGWELQLERGLDVQLPPPIGDRIDAARADLLLAPHDPLTVAALEDWGFDDEAVAGWELLGWRGRRRARTRPRPADPLAELRGIDPESEPARFLQMLRSALVRERRNGVDLLPAFAPEWLGQSLDVESLPLRSGTLSFALRWHGARPAVLWDAPAGVELRVPSLDPSWSSTTRAGEALLAEPPVSLLPMGSSDRAGEPIDAPGEFS